MCRSSPQFGVTLVMYELLQRTFYVDFGGRLETKETLTLFRYSVGVRDDNNRPIFTVLFYL